MMVKLIGWLASRECIMQWLFSMAAEYGHLYNTEEEVYMGRWSLVKTGSLASSVLSFITGGMYDHVRIHWIREPDHDRELHDHPFNYRTFVMDGWYTERFIPGDGGTLINGAALRGWQGSGKRLPPHALTGLDQVRLMSKGKSAACPLGQFHRVANVSDGGVWTLFFMGADHGKWGFLVDGRWMASRDFFKLRGIRNDGKAA